MPDNPMQKLPVRWTSYIYDTSGYADEARSILMHLDESKYQLKVIPASHQQDVLGILDPETRNRLDRFVRGENHPHPVNIVWLPAYYISRYPQARVNIGRTMFETDRIPAAWVKTCNEMDETWVPTHFNIETFTRAGVRREKLFVIPGGVDPEIYSPNAAPLGWPDKKGYNFLSIFEWNARKGWDVLLKAYFTEFSRKDDVALLLKVNITFTTEGTAKRQIFDLTRSLGLNMENMPDVHLIINNYTSAQMAALYASCDAFVMPSRGEGWGRPYMEAMAAGLPTIGTRWSGQTEFMNDDNSYLIDIDGFFEFAPYDSVHRGHLWARPSVEHTAALLRRVYENRDEAREKGRKARAEIIEKWTWRKAAEKVAQRLEIYR